MSMASPTRSEGRDRSYERWEPGHRRYDRQRHYRQRSSSRSRSRSRSRDRSRSRRMTRSRSPVISTRTNSEDPKMLNARVFIGNLPTDKVTQQDIDDMYKKYGRILGVSLFHRFGFVQFEREEDARKAVEMEAGSLVKGELVDVKMAGEGRRNPPMSRGRGRGRGGPPRYPVHSRSPREPPLERERSPLRDHYGHDPYDSYGEPYRRPGPPPRDAYERDPYDDPYGDSYRDPYREPGLLPPVNQEKIPHDCDIIAVDNQDRSYAKQIEARLRSMKMIANVININDELTLPALMEAANRKKLPYVIVVRRQNEVHHSLTLNILHGAPQGVIVREVEPKIEQRDRSLVLWNRFD